MSDKLIDRYAPMMANEELESPLAERFAALYASIDELKQTVRLATKYMIHDESCTQWHTSGCTCGYIQLSGKIDSLAAQATVTAANETAARQIVDKLPDCAQVIGGMR